ncbi:MAG: hypothetical protein PUF37_03010 [Prevotellaceae bacterium]|nr:hypothetical protein [Prevotellaceae bacterium]
MQKKTNVILTVIFWGAIWGIVEATLGWVFHSVHFRGGSLILYTFGIFCMLSAASQSKRNGTIFGTAVVAAAIKLLDLFMPNTFQGAVHPALYILMEGALIAIMGTLFRFDSRIHWNWSPVFTRRLAIPLAVVAAVLQLWLG